MKKVLFLIHDLGYGGAEKVLVNLVNNMNSDIFDITVMTLFGGGVNEQFLKPNIHLKRIFKKTFPGNSQVMKLFSPKLLHKLFIKEHYDVEVAYLEGPSSRIISGCDDGNTKKVSWVHCTMNKKKKFLTGHRSFDEACKCYSRFDKVAFVSENVKQVFNKWIDISDKSIVLYNTNDSDKIIDLSNQTTDNDVDINPDEFNIIGSGKITANKGFDRLINVHLRLKKELYNVHTYILGEGPEREKLESFIKENGIDDSVTFLGYQTNPYKYLRKSDLFVCSSHSEGFSTAATEALIVGTPVCTVNVSGMKEMLGDNNEYGIVTDNNQDDLFYGIKTLLDNRELLAYYKKQAEIRGKCFGTANTVGEVEKMLLEEK